MISRFSAVRLVAVSALAISPATASAQTKWGDVNGDGAIGAVDAQAILTAVVGLPLPAGFTKANGDANCDGALGAVDAQIVLSYVVGLNVSQFCVGTAIPVATQLVLTASAAGASSGAPFTTQPLVAIRDAAGRTDTTSTVSVTMKVSEGASVIGSATVAASNGVATFAGVGIGGRPRNKLYADV